MNWNIYSTYSLAINDDHNFKVMGGFQSEEMRQKFLVPKDMVCRWKTFRTGLDFEY